MKIIAIFVVVMTKYKKEKRDGNPYHGEYYRSRVLMVRIPRKLVEDEKFGIEN